MYYGCREGFYVLPEPEKQAVREQFAAGQEYFFYTGAIHPEKTFRGSFALLIFSKSQTGAPLKLLLAGRFAWQTGDVKTTFDEARHREDIHFLGYVPDGDLTRLMASALALAYLSTNEGFGFPCWRP